MASQPTQKALKSAAEAARAVAQYLGGLDPDQSVTRQEESSMWGQYGFLPPGACRPVPQSLEPPKVTIRDLMNRLNDLATYLDEVSLDKK